jgi:glyoxylate/hydroxypyruvate reductase A
MKIIFCCADTPADPWLAGLRTALPGAEVSLWRPGAAQADYAVVWAPPQTLIDEQPQLKGVFNIGAGVDSLANLRWPAHLPVIRLDDAGMAVQMAEYVCHAVIRHFRELDRYAVAQLSSLWAQRPAPRREEFPVGVMGLGVLGSRVAQVLQAFEFPVLAWSRTPKTQAGVRTYSGAQQFHEFLAGSRVLVNLLPLTPDTRDILNRSTLSRLRPGAYIINVARGAHLVEEDLLALLDNGHVAGATLDVFRTEPLPPEHVFWRHPAITVTPHTSARTLRDRSIDQIARKIGALQAGGTVTGQVDVGRGY